MVVLDKLEQYKTPDRYFPVEGSEEEFGRRLVLRRAEVVGVRFRSLEVPNIEIEPATRP